MYTMHSCSSAVLCREWCGLLGYRRLWCSWFCLGIQGTPVSTDAARHSTPACPYTQAANVSHMAQDAPVLAHGSIGTIHDVACT